MEYLLNKLTTQVEAEQEYVVTPLEWCCWFIRPSPQRNVAPEVGGEINLNTTTKSVLIYCCPETPVQVEKVPLNKAMPVRNVHKKCQRAYSLV